MILDFCFEKPVELFIGFFFDGKIGQIVIPFRPCKKIMLINVSLVGMKLLIV